MRLLVIATSTQSSQILEALDAEYGSDVEVVFRIGHAADDLKASALTRLNTTRSGTANLFADPQWTGAAQALFESPQFLESMQQFIDHLHRRSEINSLKSHKITTLQDFVDYYAIIADVIATQFLERRVTHCLFSNVPHLAYDTIAYQVAASLNIPCVILSQSQFPNEFYSMTAPEQFGRLAISPDAMPIPIDTSKPPEFFYMKGIKQEHERGGRLSGRAWLSMLKFVLLHRPLSLLNPKYLLSLVRRADAVYGAFPKWRDPFGRFFHADHLNYFEELAGFESAELDLSGDYVYFPLQYQPEMTTSALGGRFRDQAYAIERLAAILPEHVKILVKENPKQRGYMRGPMFFHRLQRIPNVRIVPSWANTQQLTANAQFVATITGSVGWEAIHQSTPAVVFGCAWYRCFPGVFEFTDELTYAQIRECQVDKADLERALGNLRAHTHAGVLDRDYLSIVEDYDDTKNSSQVAATIIGLLKGEVSPTFS